MIIICNIEVLKSTSILQYRSTILLQLVKPECIAADCSYTLLVTLSLKASGGTSRYMTLLHNQLQALLWGFAQVITGSEKK